MPRTCWETAWPNPGSHSSISRLVWVRRPCSVLGAASWLLLLGCLELHGPRDHPHPKPGHILLVEREMNSEKQKMWRPLTPHSGLLGSSLRRRGHVKRERVVWTRALLQGAQREQHPIRAQRGLTVWMKPHAVCPYSPQQRTHSRQLLWALPGDFFPSSLSYPLISCSGARFFLQTKLYKVWLKRVSLVRESMHFATCSQKSKTRIGTIWKEFFKKNF